MPLSGYRHTTISLICMSAHKAFATRCHLEYQAWYRQPAVWALATAPLRRLAISVLHTIMTTSYQTTCTVSDRTLIKGTRQCKPTRSSSFTLRQPPSPNTADTYLWAMPGISRSSMRLIVNHSCSETMLMRENLHRNSMLCSGLSPTSCATYVLPYFIAYLRGFCVFQTTINSRISW